MNTKMSKLAYTAPKIEVTELQLEQGIATASAKVYPQNEKDQVQDEWMVDEDDNRTIDW